MKDLSEIMRQAQQMQARLAEAQQKMEAIQAEGTAGAGLVRVRLRGKGELDALSIDPSLMAPGEAEILEDLIKAAHADARRRLEEAASEAMREATGGLAGMMPGFKLPF
ncbi:MAG: YbaB/EbfC family nucleoid-associated protein [Alphaproteobacteria bacterium]|nr:YbaB/EbfC family nucleoid-associated protein [Alphaproteobacteria bacterium]